MVFGDGLVLHSTSYSSILLIEECDELGLLYYFHISTGTIYLPGLL